MRVFKIPYETKREEKIFGGYLSLRQVIYLMLIASTLVIFIIPFMVAIKLSIIGLLGLFFLLCAFMKINEQNFDKFFFYAVKYLFRKKKFVYERCL
ncbi:MAG: PrgI family protein [Clostridia bacterium]|nr:PrgI family protein [Clostridia bacterium]